MTAAVSIVAGFSYYAASAQTAAPAAVKPASASSAVNVQQGTQTSRQVWRNSLKRVPLPKKGCFTAVYPKVEWLPVACKTPPQRPYPPSTGGAPSIVGNGTDWVAQVASGFIGSADGSFVSVAGVTSETGNGSAPNNFSLQLNTQFFTTSVCSGAANPSICRGWEQFVYSNAGYAFIQYWLINWGTTCPGGWNTYLSDCWRNAPTGVGVPVQPITNLAQLSVTGTVSASADSISLSTGTNVYSANGNNSVNAAAGWQAAEYNVFGDCCGSQANFSSGSTVVVRTSVNNGTLLAPSCQVAGYTGETNNLTLSGGPAILPVLNEARIEFTESNPAGTPMTCATSIGDTHLATFGGLFYDFQASGDFVLAQADPDFVVQTRQASGAPSWPSASLNKAVATKMGSTSVAICLAPTRLFIDGVAKNLGDGQATSLPGGISVYRGGNTYLIARKGGDSVHATLNSNSSNSWMDIAVGMPRTAPAKMRGLVVNPNGNIGALAMRNGTVLSAPVSFTDLYHRYADSWRVQPNESLLSPCGGKGNVRGIPVKAFYAKDLAPQQYQKARATCTAAGIRETTALEACTLDAAVLGNAVAAKVYVRPLAIRAVLKPNVGLQRVNINPTTVKRVP